MFLGIDCSGVCANLILLLPDGGEFHAQSDTPRQADVIFLLLEKLLADAGAKISDLSAIGAITGPGSFTGIRVGLSLAQGLADGLKIQAYGMDAFTAMGTNDENIIVLESKRAELYVKRGNREPEMLLPTEITGTHIIHNTQQETFGAPAAINMASLAARHAKLQSELKLPGEILAPYYIREADAKPSAV